LAKATESPLSILTVVKLLPSDVRSGSNLFGTELPPEVRV